MPASAPDLAYPQDLDADEGNTYWKKQAQRVGEWIGEHPQASLITALSLGILIGWLGKRK